MDNKITSLDVANWIHNNKDKLAIDYGTQVLEVEIVVHAVNEECILLRVKRVD